MTVGLPVRLGLLGAVTQLSSSLVEPVDVSTLHSIETIVIDWSHQIREILSKDSAQPLLEGLHPLPRAEFEFWRTRSLHLQCINEQVRPRRAVWPGCVPHPNPTVHPPQLLSPRVTALAEILEKANSCYWPALQAMFRDVSAGGALGDTWAPTFAPARGIPDAHTISHLCQACRKPTTSASTCSRCRSSWKRWSRQSTPR